MRYSLIDKYLGKIIKKRRKLNNSEKSQLLHIIGIKNADRLERLLEKTRVKVKNFEKIFGIVKELNNKTDSNQKIDDMFAELRAAAFLLNQGFTNIVYNRKLFDFSCAKNKKQWAVEVKFIRGPDFKRQKEIDTGLAYQLNSKPEIQKLKNKIDKAYKQLENLNANLMKSIIIICNNSEYIFEGTEFLKEICDFIKEQKKEKNLEIYFINNWGELICN